MDTMQDLDTLMPLPLTYARPVTEPLPEHGALSYDPAAQIALLDGAPLAAAAGKGTKSTYSSDGQDAIALDEGGDD